MTSTTANTIRNINDVRQRADAIRSIIQGLPASHMSQVRKDGILSMITDLEISVEHATVNLAQEMAKAIDQRERYIRSNTPFTVTPPNQIESNIHKVMMGLMGEAVNHLTPEAESLRARIDTLLWVVNGVHDGR